MTRALHMRATDFSMTAIAPAALALALFYTPGPPALAAEAIPTLDVKRSCAVDQSAPNSIPDPNCLQQEEQAKKQLQAIWSQTAPQTRATCIGSDADSPQKSYVDILTCVQMFKDAQ